MDYQISEQAVLSACLRDESGLSSAKACELLTESDFSTESHQKIFNLINQKHDINEVDVAIELPECSEDALALSERYGGGKVDRYIEQLVSSRNQRITDLALKEAMDALNQGTSVENIAGQFNSKVAKALSSGSGQSKVGNAVRNARDEFFAIDDGNSTAVSTGFKTLDFAFGGGFQRGRLYALGARPGIGKSALAIQFSHQVASKGYRVAYASLEMSATECAGRMLVRDSMVYRPRKKGDLTELKRQKIEESVNRMSSLPLTFKDDNKATLDSFRAFLFQQLLSAHGFKSRTQEVDFISRSLKQLAMELDVPILALSQLNRNLETAGRDPMLSDLRESGAIEQDCDTARKRQVEIPCYPISVSQGQSNRIVILQCFSPFTRMMMRMRSHLTNQSK
jgi:replicative DNA helicase